MSQRPGVQKKWRATATKVVGVETAQIGRVAQLLAYVVIQLYVVAKAGAGCDKANRSGTKVRKM